MLHAPNIRIKGCEEYLYECTAIISSKEGIFCAWPCGPDAELVFGYTAIQVRLTGVDTQETDPWVSRIPYCTYTKWTPADINALPVPAAVWLFGTALIGLFGFSKRRKAA